MAGGTSSCHFFPDHVILSASEESVYSFLISHNIVRERENSGRSSLSRPGATSLDAVPAGKTGKLRPEAGPNAVLAG